MQAPPSADLPNPAGGTPVVNQIIDAFGMVIYFTLGVLAVWGIYNIILVFSGLKRANIKGRPNPLLTKVEPLLEQNRYDEVIQICRSPQYRATALGQLVAVAVQNRAKSLGKIKQLLVSEFHTEIIAPMEIRLASIGTIVRLGPLIGLLGTVASMIGAFGRIGGSSKVDPNALASDIALALWATGGGLIIATPFMIIGNAVHAKIRRLRDNTERQLTEVFDILEETGSIGTKAAPARQPAAAGRPAR
ncbi:MotA/TolQ/ExbB proton channel family protein [bacterium]|nr:MotA/TolQ/ExbB proton channel family protein [bacterium]